jgi:hypothetical protein
MLNFGTCVTIKGKKEPHVKPWLKPPEGWVKLTVDGSFKVEDGLTCTGMVLRDADGNIISSAC